jgi:SAM-dependent methyltransferase
MVQGRRVLDVGSGEGFGAAILGEHAAEVVGIDIDGTTVEHSQLNYGRPGLEFRSGNATDLSMFEPDTFDAVVAFEMIEHVAEHDQVLAEIHRVLRDDGILIISTPDRRAYSEAPGYQNPFHVRELAADEFAALIGGQFAHYEMFGQVMIAGSQINALDSLQPTSSERSTANFLIAPSGEEWRLAPAFSPRYVLVVASNAPLSPTPRTSTLADAEVTVVKIKDGELSRLGERIEQLTGELAVKQSELAAREAKLVEISADLDRARGALAELEASVSVQLVRALSARFYRVVPKESRPARALQATLRLIGRVFVRKRS